MQFDDDKVDTSELDDQRGRSGGGGGLGDLGGLLAGGSGGGGSGGGGGGLGGAGGTVLAGGVAKMLGGGGLAALVVIGILVFGVLAGGGDSSTGALIGGTGAGQSSQAGTGTDLAARCSSAAAIQQYDDCYVLKSFNEINEVWAAQFAAEGRRYTKPRLVYFDGRVSTGGCGRASSAAGPFYCPADSRVYIDLGFMNQLFTQIGASGRYAQTYVVAHEVGHHLQNILGIEAQVRRAAQQSPRQANALSVKAELQADCFAGVYGRLANDAGNQRITQEEYAQALAAAAAVGDDRILAGAGQRVDPEAFTHGSAAQRQYWFEQGFANPTLATCNTFAT